MAGCRGICANMHHGHLGVLSIPSCHATLITATALSSSL